MPNRAKKLPEHLPEGAEYVLESRDWIIHRRVEWLDDQPIALPPRGPIAPLEEAAVTTGAAPMTWPLALVFLAHPLMMAVLTGRF